MSTRESLSAQLMQMLICLSGCSCRRCVSRHSLPLRLQCHQPIGSILLCASRTRVECPSLSCGTHCAGESHPLRLCTRRAGRRRCREHTDHSHHSVLPIREEQLVARRVVTHSTYAGHSTRILCRGPFSGRRFECGKRILESCCQLARVDSVHNVCDITCFLKSFAFSDCRYSPKGFPLMQILYCDILINNCVILSRAFRGCPVAMCTKVAPTLHMSFAALRAAPCESLRRHVMKVAPNVRRCRPMTSSATGRRLLFRNR